MKVRRGTISEEDEASGRVRKTEDEYERCPLLTHTNIIYINYI